MKKRSPEWPVWVPTKSFKKNSSNKFVPTEHAIRNGNVLSYGASEEGHEEFLILAERKKRPVDEPRADKDALYVSFDPTSHFTGENPIGVPLSKLNSRDGKRSYFYKSESKRASYFYTFSSLKPEAKGLLVYQTSIMLLSDIERRIVKSFQKRGWNVLVALPASSLYHIRMPVDIETKADEQNAIRFIAKDMDRHYAQQAEATKIALSYLKKTRPDWLNGKRALILSLIHI